jgi:hypothetical protein
MILVGSDWGWTEQETLDRQKFSDYIPQALALIASRQGTTQFNHGDRQNHADKADANPVDRLNKLDRSDLTGNLALTDPLWGWKDPRTTLMLDFWHELMPQARYLLVYRSPWDVADSILRLNSHIFSLHPDYALRAWHYYNQHLLNFYHRHQDQCILINVNAALQTPLRWLELLQSRLQIKINANQAIEKVNAVFDPKIFRSLDLSHPTHPTVQLIAQVYPEAVDLLSQLDQAADLPSNITGSDHFVGFRGATNLDHDRLNPDTNGQGDAAHYAPNFSKPGDRFSIIKSALLLHLQILQAQTAQQQSQREIEQIEQSLKIEAEPKPQLQELDSLQDLSDRQAQKLAELAKHQAKQAATITQLREQIASMESSKFWRLRQIWFRFKAAIGMRIN